MANTRISNAAAIAGLDALLDLIDVGGTGTIEIRTGAPPATCETADSGTLLGTLTFAATAFAGAVDGTDKAVASRTASITGDSSADTGGTAAHFRSKSGGGTVVIQGDITATSGGGDLELDTVTVTAGDTIDITAYDVEFPEA
jgi:hypothetical protein